jgi:hypothetical protein
MRRDRTVGLGQDPRRCALEQVQLADAWRDLRHELNRARARADHARGFAVQVELVIPTRRVKQRALEAAQSGDLGIGRPAQPAGRAGDDVELGALAALQRQRPSAGRVIEARGFHAAVETDVRAQRVFVGAVLEVRADLFLLGEHARPARVLLERERVHVRLHVAGHARVVVVAPGAADGRRLLEDGEVVDAGLLEPDPHAQAGEAAADHRDAEVLLGGLRGCVLHRRTASRASIRLYTSSIRM